jgi:hypothetical protein
MRPPGQDELLIELPNGRKALISIEKLSEELAEAAKDSEEPELLAQAARAVIHYFKHELGRQRLTLAELARALEKVLRYLRQVQASKDCDGAAPEVVEADLGLLAEEAAAGGELFFFPRLRRELKRILLCRPRVLRFRGLRGCVKQLVGAQRRGLRCRQLEEQIVGYLRRCLCVEAGRQGLVMVVE